jgi:hypothetical protein
MVGLLAAAPAVAEILTANQRTINPASGLAAAALWLGSSVLAGAAVGRLAGRAASLAKLPPGDGAAFLAGTACGHLFLPPPWGATFGAAVTLLRVLRRMIFRRYARLDALAPFAPSLLAGAILFERPFPMSPFPGPDRPLAAVVPAPGAIPVTVSVHTETDFPDVPAVHLRLRELNAEEAGRRAALWSGRAPARTRAGCGTPRLLPGGGGLSWIPRRPGAQALARLLPAGSDDPQFAPRAPLWRIAEAGGIPVLRGLPSPEDPPLHLRILERDHPPDRNTAERLRREGAWIDVRLGARGDRIALSGQGIAVSPGGPEASLLDVAPTVMHLLGLPVPRSGDGRVLRELLDPASTGARPIRYRNNPGTRRDSTASRNSRSLRTGSKDGSARKRSGQVGSNSSARSSRSAAAEASPASAATAAFT